MSPSLRALLAGLIDYAGLFPPAKLPLDQAITNYARYRAGPEAWMLGRFICPAARLAELAPFAGLFAEGPPFAFSALGRGGAGKEEFLEGFQEDLREVAAFRERHGGRVRVDVLEARVPADMTDLPSEDAARALLPVARSASSAGLTLFCEAGGRPGALVPLLRRLRDDAGQPVGFKLRCGGLEASAFPSAAQVGQALKSCLDDGVPFKATAGLHHPFPRFDPAVRATMHGFVNLFTAGVLAPSEELMRPLLEDADPSHFTFDDRGVNYRGLRASTEEIEAARRKAVLSFGSCSFDEPRDDLRALGWL